MKYILTLLALITTCFSYENGGSISVEIDGKQLKEIFHPNGKIKFKFTLIRNGNGKQVIDGIKKNFYPNGQLRGTEIYKMGKPEGKWIYFYETGEQYNELFFENGKKVKTWTRWNKDKSKIGEVTFSYEENDQLVTEKQFKNGKVIKIKKYKNGNEIKS